MQKKRIILGLSGIFMSFALIVSAFILGNPFCSWAYTSPNANVIIEEDSSLSNHTIYRPKDLANLAEKLPIVVWGESACLFAGGSFKKFLAEIASKNYLVIADNGFNTLWPTNHTMLLDSITWAIAENSRSGSKYYGKLKVTKIAVMGHSCGGLQALHNGGDPRVSTVVAWDSGIFDDGSMSSGMGGATKDDLLALHTPTMWVNAGPSDIAYAQAEKDFAEVPDYVPAVWANYDLSEKGSSVLGAHMGTFYDDKGGEFARVGILWLDFILKGKVENKSQFIGQDCVLNTVPKWSVQSKNWD